MNEYNIISEQTLALPAAPYRAQHYINGAYVDSADGQVSDRMSPSHGVVVSQAALST